MKSHNSFSKVILNTTLGFILCLMSFIAYGTSSNITQPITDTAVTAAIKAKYAQNPILSAFDIHVETNNGIVKLSGLVDSDTQYERAIILAENTDGVKGIDNAGLKTKSSAQPLEDSVITAKIKGLLLKNKLVHDETEANPWPIHVETKNGIVFITGTVANHYQKDQVIKIAKTVEGVKSVKADLQIK